MSDGACPGLDPGLEWLKTRQFGSVEIPQGAFIKALKMGED